MGMTMRRSNPSDEEWYQAEAGQGWELPEPAAWPLRLWGVRYVRALWHGYRADKMAGELAKFGLGTGYITPYDEWRLYAIWRGWV